MKKNLLILLTLISSFVASSQCTPADYSFGSAEFGVSPDPVLGESFEIGEVGVPYADIIYMLVPVDAGDVDSAFAGFGTIDSLKLESVFIFNGTDFVDVSNIGLGFTCNNLGDSPDPCTFMGGSQYCADLTGTPTQAGVYPLQINVTGYIDSFLGSVEVPYAFEDYSITILGPDAVSEITKQEIGSLQNTPNPVVSTTEISFELTKADVVKLSVSNLLGESVFSKTINAKRGVNVLVLDASQFGSGLYLYSITAGEKKITKRMVVN